MLNRTCYSTTNPNKTNKIHGHLDFFSAHFSDYMKCFRHLFDCCRRQEKRKKLFIIQAEWQFSHLCVFTGDVSCTHSVAVAPKMPRACILQNVKIVKARRSQKKTRRAGKWHAHSQTCEWATKWMLFYSFFFSPDFFSSLLSLVWRAFFLRA